MRKISTNEIKNAISFLCLECAYNLEQNVIENFYNVLKNEEEKIAKKVIRDIIKNSQIAKEEKIPLCQDTGFVVVFLEIGNQVLVDGNIIDSINDGIREAFHKYYLRKSIVIHPLKRENSLDNTPGIIYTKPFVGDSLKITLSLKGAGSENMSRLAMLTPSVGKKGVIDFVVNTIKECGSTACPPLVVGVGIGGSFEKVALLSKEALLRDINDKSTNEIDDELEKELLDKINSLKIGPMGFGGKTTALAVKVNSHPCHIASLPVAVNLQCHSIRTKTKTL